MIISMEDFATWCREEKAKAQMAVDFFSNPTAPARFLSNNVDVTGAQIESLKAIIANMDSLIEAAEATTTAEMSQ